jgi:hypothetical protein
VGWELKYGNERLFRAELIMGLRLVYRTIGGVIHMD